MPILLLIGSLTTVVFDEAVSVGSRKNVSPHLLCHCRTVVEDEYVREVLVMNGMYSRATMRIALHIAIITAVASKGTLPDEAKLARQRVGGGLISRSDRDAIFEHDGTLEALWEHETMLARMEATRLLQTIGELSVQTLAPFESPSLGPTSIAASDVPSLGPTSSATSPLPTTPMVPTETASPTSVVEGSDEPSQTPIDATRPTLSPAFAAPSPIPELNSSPAPTESTLLPTRSSIPTAESFPTLPPTSTNSSSSQGPIAGGETTTPTLSMSPSRSFTPTQLAGGSGIPTMLVTDGPSLSARPSADQTCLMGRTLAAYLLDLLTPVTDPALLQNMETPQGKAFDFMTNDPFVKAMVCIYPSLEQRYGLATFYFSTQGSLWTTKTGWLSASNECAWYGIVCNDNVRASNLTLSKYFVLYKKKLRPTFP
jgi:hypothetical protein